jgi:hypothetical protein
MVVALSGVGLLALASFIGGAHAQGHWIQSAKLVGVFLLAIAAFGIAVLLIGPTRRDDRST